MLEVRLATLNDVEAICRLYNEFFAYNAGLQPKYYKAGEELGEYPKNTIEDQNADIFIAVENNDAVGFIHIRKAKTPAFDSVVPHNYAQIIDFIVTTSCREKGIGSRLMDAAKLWSRDLNLEYIELLVLHNANEAFSFYERKDFDTVSHTMRCTL